MEIVKYHFAFFTIVLIFLCSETASYRADRIRQDFKFLKSEMSYMREDISALFNRTDQLNVSVIEGCDQCVSGNTPMTNHDGRQDNVKVNNKNILLKYRSLINAFVTEKKINRELQHQLRSMEDKFSACEKMAKESGRRQKSQLQSMKASISAIEKKMANEGYKELLGRLQTIEDSISRSEKASYESKTELQNRLRSIDKSIENKISNIYRDLRKNFLKPAPVIRSSCKSVPESGVYFLFSKSTNVYCDQKTDGGGWMVFMRRQDGSVNFDRSWLDYKHGFGSPDGEFWAGNELLYSLTEPSQKQLRIDMEDFDGNTAFAMYEEFRIGNETDKYRLYVSGYSGTAGDSLIHTGYSGSKHAGMQFSTFDSDNDKSRDNCAMLYIGGWWYNDCSESYLNAPYSKDKTASWDKGIIWLSWKGDESLKRVEMKIRT